MNRTLIKLGPISIYWYSVMIALGFLAAMVVCLTEVKRKKLDIEKYSNMVFYAVLFGILGARIYSPRTNSEEKDWMIIKEIESERTTMKNSEMTDERGWITGKN